MKASAGDEMLNSDINTTLRNLDGVNSEAKTAVVTDGDGFLGSRLCDFLLEHDYRVICVDNFVTSQLTNLE